MAAIQAIRGMNDVLPDQAAYWQRVESVLVELFGLYGYREVRFPVLEKTELFARSIGADTDIVAKEMYTFIDRNGDSLTLRPEGTASCARLGLQHGLFHNQQQRLWYLGPMFRHERPQRGRYRQFHQAGAEAFGWDGPDIDAELIALTARIWRSLGITAASLQVNSLGDAAARRAYRERLLAYLSPLRGELDADSQRRLDTNPLRILDSKHPATQAVLVDAPLLRDHLDQDSVRHFEGLCGYLDEAGIPYEINSRLVRGLDYYSRSVFEWVSGELGSQGTVCAGGRYDTLVEQLGGRHPVPAVGFALGLERLVELLTLGDNENPSGVDVYVVVLDEAARLAATQIAEQLRDRGLRVQQHCGGGGAKSQLKRADRSGAQVAVVLGEEEISAGRATVKPLRRDAPQFSVGQEKLAAALAKFFES